jgi:hypothetical protein
VPEQPHVDEEVLVDASGQASDEAATEWSWDLDGDGTFELDWADRPTVRTTFTSTGLRQVGVRIRYLTARGSNGWFGFTLQTTVLPPHEAVPTGGFAWPSIALPIGPSGAPGRVRSPASTATVSTPRRTLVAPRRVSATTLRRRGVIVRVRSARAGLTSASLAGSGWRSARASRRLSAGRSATLRLRPVRVRACRSGTVVLRLRLVWPDRAVSRRSLRVACRGR